MSEQPTPEPIQTRVAESLSAVLDKTSFYYEKKVDGLITIMLSLIEPILIVTVGSIVLVVVLAMYLPIFSIQV